MIDFCLESLGLGLLFGEVLLPFFDVSLVFPGLGGDGGGIVAGLEGEKIDVDLKVVHADLLGLIEAPLVAGAVLH